MIRLGASAAVVLHNVPNGLSTGVHYDSAMGTPFDKAMKLIADEVNRDLPPRLLLPLPHRLDPHRRHPPSGGGLTYLANSTSLGKSLEGSFLSASRDLTSAERISGFNKNMMRDGQLTHDAEKWGKEVMPQGRKWLVAGYEAGDVVFHNPWMVHGSAKNEVREGRIGLGVM